MAERYWYIKGEKKEGPFSKEELSALAEKKKIDRETLIWSLETDSWEPLSSLEAGEEKELDIVTPSMVEEKVIGRPWVRFWARMLDYLFFAFVIGILTGLFNIPVPHVHQVLFSMLIIFLWCFVESFLLATWGFTPGKWLLRTEVRRKEGGKLSYREALSRSFSVWWLGMGAGIPIVWLITMIVGGVKLSKHGITTWDKASHLSVTHYRIGYLRIFFVILFFLFATLLLLSGFFHHGK